MPQRRPIDRNDLPQVQAELGKYLGHLRVGEPFDDSHPTLGQVVLKETVAADGDYNLSGDWYWQDEIHEHDFPLVSLGDAELFRVEGGGTPKSDVKEYWNGAIPWITLVDLPSTDMISEIRDTQRTISEIGLEKSSAKLIPENSVIVSTRATIGRIGINRVRLATNQGFKSIIIQDGARAIPEYVALAVTKLVPVMDAWASGGTFKEISKSKFCQLQIPLPPLEKQKEIVAEIEGYQKVIDGARAVVENYRPHIVVDPEWPTGSLGDVCLLISGQHVNRDDYNTNHVGIGYLTGPADFGERYTTFSKWTTKPKVIAERGDILIAVKGSGLGKVNLMGADKAAIGRQLMAIRAIHAVPEYIYSYLVGMYSHIQSLGSGAAIPGITRDDVLRMRIPLPALKEQEAIVAGLSKDRGLVKGNRELIERFEGKIEAALTRVWGS